MSKSQNIHDTLRWKKKRKNHWGDKCDNSNCGICARHKNVGNSIGKGKNKAKYNFLNKQLIDE